MKCTALGWTAVVFLAGWILAAVAWGQRPSDGDTERYRVGAEDVLTIQVVGNPDFSGPVEVSPSGTIQLPLVGELEVGGRTVAELSADLTARYRLFDSSITEVIVTVGQYNALQVSVVGEVRSPGRYGFREIPDLWAVLLAAGGTTPEADLARIEIVHKEADEDGTRVRQVDLSRGIESSASSVPALRTKDTIVVPSLVEQRGASDKVFVLGAVRAPGAYRIAVAATVIEALSASGGPLPNARLEEIQLTRKTSTGAISYALDLEGYLRGARPAADLPLRSGDTLTIPEEDSALQSILGGILRFAPLVTVVTSLVVTLQ